MRANSIYRSVFVIACLAQTGCGESDPAGLAATPSTPLDVTAEAVGPTSIRISWTRVDGALVSGYDVLRRENLDGEFRHLATVLPSVAGRASHFDADLKPLTYYGYRVVALSTLGGRSAPSTVGGARTAPTPGLVVSVVTEIATEDAADNDGYVVRLLGPRDTVTAPIAATGERRFTPLGGGSYSVVLRGLASNCDFRSGDSTRVAQVQETGLDTEARLRYEVSCRDKRKGSLVVRYEQEGDTTDPNGVRLAITGLLDADSNDTTRVYSRTDLVTSRIAVNRYDNLRPGQYEVAVDDVASACNVAGTRRRSVRVRALSLDTVRFTAVCARPIVSDTLSRPLILENRWSASAAPLGAKVSLTVGLDATARPARSFVGYQGVLAYPSTVFRYDSAARSSDLGIVVRNGSNPGLVILGTVDTEGIGRTGRFDLARVWFTVIGETGASARSGTTVQSLLTGAPSVEYKDSVRVREATFTVGQFSSGNVAPTARTNGPYTADAGVAIQLTAGGSSDPDGTISSYTWALGDGSTKTGESITHTYQAAGTYIARLTVTDNLGATSSDSAIVTVKESGAPNQPPVAAISAPTTGAPNTSIAFSGATSRDADGTIATYAWTFGDGSSSSGPTVTHSYASAGTYTVQLTVTDNRGATASATHTVVISATNPVTTPFAWRASFGSVDSVTKQVDLTLTLDLSANIADTPGREELQSFVVDSLKWDTRVLQLMAFNFGPGQQQGIDHTHVPRGVVAFNGQTLPALNGGVIAIAKIRFRVVGTRGASVTTQTVVGPLIGTPATGSFNYRSKTEIREATLTVP